MNNQQKGFTLVELIVVFAIFFIVTGAGMVRFSQFSSQQLLDSSVKDVTAFLNITRSSAASQNMLGLCNQALLRYSVRFIAPDTYRMWAYCNSTNYNLNKTQKLPKGITFDTGTSPEISFFVQTGYSPGGTLKLKGNGAVRSIIIDNSGNISVQ